MSANDNVSHIRNTSESALSNIAPFQNLSSKKRPDLNLALRMVACVDAERESALGSSISALTEEPANTGDCGASQGGQNPLMKQGLNTARTYTESGDSNNFTYSESGYNPTGSLRHTISTQNLRSSIGRQNQQAYVSSNSGNRNQTHIAPRNTLTTAGSLRQLLNDDAILTFSNSASLLRGSMPAADPHPFLPLTEAS